MPERPAARPLERFTDADLRSAMSATGTCSAPTPSLVLNSLNVYPVPDADTGTNMTVEAVVAALGQTSDMTSTCRVISRKRCWGPGISGVILAQLLRAASDWFAPRRHHPRVVLAEALTEASSGTDRAVAHLVEGTILTVARTAALAATTAAETKRLAEARCWRPCSGGVLEAGGAGFILLLDALPHVAAGRPLPEPPPASLPAYPALRPGVSAAAEGPRYEVALLLESSQGRIDDLRAAWNRMGSSVVTVGGTAPGAAMSTPTRIGGMAPTGC